MNNIESILKKLKSEVINVFAEKKQQMLIYDINAFNQILKYLDQMILECEANQLKQKEMHYPYIAKIVIEIPTSILDPELGGRLIEAEKEYIQHQ